MNENFTFEKAGIIELLEANMNERHKSLHLNRVSGDDGATTIKNTIEVHYEWKWFIALFESDEYNNYSSIQSNKFFKANQPPHGWLNCVNSSSIAIFGLLISY